MIGTELTKHLSAKGYNVIILTRKMPETKSEMPLVSYALWDVKKQRIDVEAVQKADVIIHLAGAGVVEKKWTDKYKKEIIDSRTETIGLIINTLKNNANKVEAVISASAIGWYGADPAPLPEGFVESDKNGGGYIGDTCKLWEESIDPVKEMGKRVVKIRTGIVLSHEGGALIEFEKPVKFGVAGILDSGKQIVSWIHIDDLCRLYIEAIENKQVNGVYNGVATQPVTNKELTLKLAKTLKGNFFIPVHVPEFILKLMMGERRIEVLKSTTVSNGKIKNAGFTFLYPSIEAALLQLTGKKN